MIVCFFCFICIEVVTASGGFTRAVTKNSEGDDDDE